MGFRTPSYKKSFKARTTGSFKRSIKRSINPMYGKKGMGWVNNPKKAIYNKIYNKTTVGITDILRPKPVSSFSVVSERNIDESDEQSELIEDITINSTFLNNKTKKPKSKTTITIPAKGSYYYQKDIDKLYKKIIKHLKLDPYNNNTNDYVVRKNGDKVYEYDKIDIDTKIVPEPDNEHDKNAHKIVAIHSDKETLIGYLPKDIVNDPYFRFMNILKASTYFCGGNYKYYDSNQYKVIDVSESVYPVTTIEFGRNNEMMKHFESFQESMEEEKRASNERQQYVEEKERRKKLLKVILISIGIVLFIIFLPYILGAIILIGILSIIF